MNDQIYCPQCGSNQITVHEKGFSGTKAAAGAILTGGIGLLAGTIGKNNLIITCLACGKQFKPGEGGKGVEAMKIESELVDRELLRIYSLSGWPRAVTYLKQHRKLSPLAARQYVEKLGRDNNITPPKSGCSLLLILLIAAPVFLFEIIKHL